MNVIRLLNGSQKAALAPIVAGMIGATAWGVGDLAGLAVLLFPVWSLAPTRTNAFFVVAGYYLGGAWIIPPASAVFFGNDSSLAFGIIIWMATSAFNALPWAFLWQRRDQSAQDTFLLTLLRLTLIFVLILFPPFAFSGWLNPFVGIAWLFPHLGMWSFVCALLLATLVVTALDRSARIGRDCAAVIVCSAVACGLLQMPLPSPPRGWVGIDTQVSPFPTTDKELFEHRNVIRDSALTEFWRGNKVIVFPESILGSWNLWTSGVYLEGSIRSELRTYDGTVIAGATTPFNDAGDYRNSLYVMNAEGITAFHARQPIPIAMWKPWGEKSALANWAPTNVHSIAGKRALLSFCYEDFIPLLPIYSFLVGEPELIISIANTWWVKGTNEREIQYRHIATIARIFNVPLVRAVNK